MTLLLSESFRRLVALALAATFLYIALTYKTISRQHERQPEQIEPDRSHSNRDRQEAAQALQQYQQAEARGQLQKPECDCSQHGEQSTKAKKALESVPDLVSPSSDSSNSSSAEKALLVSVARLHAAANLQWEVFGPDREAGADSLMPKGYHFGMDIPSKDAHLFMLVTSWRTGSTFLGELLGQYPTTFYSYEPLVVYGSHRSPGPDRVKIVEDFLTCAMTPQYMAKALSINDFSTVNLNRRLKRVCKDMMGAEDTACYDHDVFNGVCKLHPVRTIKVTRLVVSDVEALLGNPNLPRLKIIVLFRDPRAMMNSRATFSWCKTPTCRDVPVVCEQLASDLASTHGLAAKFPGRVRMVRYEDVSQEPELFAQHIIKFLGLAMTEGTREYVSSHTGTAGVGEHTTRRHSRNHTFVWRRKTNWQRTEQIQSLCADSMAKLGYVAVHTEEQLRDENVKLLTKTDKNVWPY